MCPRGNIQLERQPNEDAPALQDLSWNRNYIDFALHPRRLQQQVVGALTDAEATVDYADSAVGEVVRGDEDFEEELRQQRVALDAVDAGWDRYPLPETSCLKDQAALRAWPLLYLSAPTASTSIRRAQVEAAGSGRCRRRANLSRTSFNFGSGFKD